MLRDIKLAKSIMLKEYLLRKASLALSVKELILTGAGRRDGKTYVLDNAG